MQLTRESDPARLGRPSARAAVVNGAYVRVRVSLLSWVLSVKLEMTLSNCRGIAPAGFLRLRTGVSKRSRKKNFTVKTNFHCEGKSEVLGNLG